MENVMCPMVSHKNHFCDGKQCAWWDSRRNMCAVMLIAVSLDRLATDGVIDNRHAAPEGQR